MISSAVRKASLAAIITMVMTTGAALASGGTTCSVVDPIWERGHDQGEEAIIGDEGYVDRMRDSVADESTKTNNELLSAIKVATRQRSLSAERDASASRATAEAVANAYIEQRTSEQIRRAHEEYGPQGQMVGACDMIQSLKVVDSTMRGRMDRAAEVMSSDAIDGNPGSGVTPLEAAARRLHYEDEPKSVSATAFMDDDTSSEMRDAYMNNVIGLPYHLPEGGVESTQDNLLYMQVRRWEAMRSPAITSLAAVRASAEQTGHFDTGREMSYVEALDWYIEQFGGGPKYDEWSSALVTKSEVGLRKEIARLRAINLMLSKYRQESSDRRLAVLATLLAGEAVK